MKMAKKINLYLKPEKIESKLKILILWYYLMPLIFKSNSFRDQKQ